MFLGRRTQGTEIVFRVLASDVEGQNLAGPSNPPVLQILNSSGTLLYTGKMAATNRNVENSALFQYNLYLDSNYGAGLYRARISWAIANRSTGSSPPGGTHYGLQLDYFQVVAGGHQDGASLSMAFWDRPNAKYIVRHHESGRIVAGKNPYL